MKAIWNGVQLAESDDVIELEGNVYFPPESLDRRRLKETRMRTLCPWKGVARYYTVEANGAENPHAAWYYPRPFPWIRRIRGYVAFWSGVRVEP